MGEVPRLRNGLLEERLRLNPVAWDDDDEGLSSGWPRPIAGANKNIRALAGLGFQAVIGDMKQQSFKMTRLKWTTPTPNPFIPRCIHKEMRQMIGERKRGHGGIISWAISRMARICRADRTRCGCMFGLGLGFGALGLG